MTRHSRGRLCHRRRIVRWSVRGSACAIAGILFAIVLVIWLALAEPAYWRPIDGADPAVREAAERFERGLTAALSRVRPDGEPWRLAVSQRQINRWLAARLPRWLENQQMMPELRHRLGRPMVRLADGTLELAVPVEWGGARPVVRLRYTARPGREGPARLALAAAHLGRLPISERRITHRVERRAARLAEAMRSIELVLPLGDGRDVIVDRVQIDEGEATLTCRTVHRVD